jgi:hypothetical protein
MVEAVGLAHSYGEHNRSIESQGEYRGPARSFGRPPEEWDKSGRQTEDSLIRDECDDSSVPK